MNFRLGLIVFFLINSNLQPVRPDLSGPSVARHASSPDGNVLVRIKTLKRAANARKLPIHEVAYYHFDASSDTYSRKSHFVLKARLSQMLHVSNSGELILISLAEQNAIRLYSRNGKLSKSWNWKMCSPKRRSRRVLRQDQHYSGWKKDHFVVTFSFFAGRRA